MCTHNSSNQYTSTASSIKSANICVPELAARPSSRPAPKEEVPQTSLLRRGPTDYSPDVLSALCHQVSSHPPSSRHFPHHSAVQVFPVSSIWSLTCLAHFETQQIPVDVAYFKLPACQAFSKVEHRVHSLPPPGTEPAPYDLCRSDHSFLQGDLRGYASDTSSTIGPLKTFARSGGPPFDRSHCNI